jgi:hypothetical protein
MDKSEINKIKHHKSTFMFKIFFKTTIRSVWKSKGYSFLNIFGLAIGIACAGLIFLWVEDEIDFDSFNVKQDRLYFARVNAVADVGIWTHWSTPGVMAPVMQQQILAAYTAERRTKEISVRKVLGASVSGIATLLSKDFIKLVAISCLVAFLLDGR